MYLLAQIQYFAKKYLRKIELSYYKDLQTTLHIKTIDEERMSAVLL